MPYVEVVVRHHIGFNVELRREGPPRRQEPPPWRHSSGLPGLGPYCVAERGQSAPWFWLVIGPNPLNTNFCRRLPSYVSVV